MGGEGVAAGAMISDIYVRKCEGHGQPGSASANRRNNSKQDMPRF